MVPRSHRDTFQVEQRGDVVGMCALDQETGDGRLVRGTPGDVVEITVRDTGSGIDAELLPHVFDRFARGAGSTGSGLGLSIARGLVELHGGAIEATSPPGGATEIRIRLPIVAPRR